jgi:hypothetical protein
MANSAIDVNKLNTMSNRGIFRLVIRLLDTNHDATNDAKPNKPVYTKHTVSPAQDTIIMIDG